MSDLKGNESRSMMMELNRTSTVDKNSIPFFITEINLIRIANYLPKVGPTYLDIEKAFELINSTVPTSTFRLVKKECDELNEELDPRRLLLSRNDWPSLTAPSAITTVNFIIKSSNTLLSMLSQQPETFDSSAQISVRYESLMSITQDFDRIRSRFLDLLINYANFLGKISVKQTDQTCWNCHLQSSQSSERSITNINRLWIFNDFVLFQLFLNRKIKENIDAVDELTERFDTDDYDGNNHSGIEEEVRDEDNNQHNGISNNTNGNSNDTNGNSNDTNGNINDTNGNSNDTNGNSNDTSESDIEGDGDEDNIQNSGENNDFSNSGIEVEENDDDDDDDDDETESTNGDSSFFVELVISYQRCLNCWTKLLMMMRILMEKLERPQRHRLRIMKDLKDSEALRFSHEFQGLLYFLERLNYGWGFTSEVDIDRKFKELLGTLIRMREIFKSKSKKSKALRGKVDSQESIEDSDEEEQTEKQIVEQNRSLSLDDLSYELDGEEEDDQVWLKNWIYQLALVAKEGCSSHKRFCKKHLDFSRAGINGPYSIFGKSEVTEESFEFSSDYSS
ncbi:hypothetical protein BY996DRAFT_6570385 [Phakopsora pachyrhizi]|nr:hypothetical protein BY996DRAFT_6570385 [Phakopsora pachyrhizi]